MVFRDKMVIFQQSQSNPPRFAWCLLDHARFKDILIPISRFLGKQDWNGVAKTKAIKTVTKKNAR